MIKWTNWVNNGYAHSSNLREVSEAIGEYNRALAMVQREKREVFTEDDVNWLKEMEIAL